MSTFLLVHGAWHWRLVLAARGTAMPIAMRAILGSPGPVPFADMAGQLGIPTQRIDGGHDLMITSPKRSPRRWYRGLEPTTKRSED
jgi:hypothetical protein